MSKAASDCIFCKIVDGRIPSPRVFENEEFICIRDIQPHAKTHLLVIPKKHIPSLGEAYPESGNGSHEMMGKLLEVATKVARDQGLFAGGFRTVINTGSNAGQTVFHIHVHVLGGEPLSGSLA